MIRTDSDLERKVASLKVRLEMVLILSREHSLLPLAAVRLIREVWDDLGEIEGYLVTRRFGGRG